MSKCYNILVMTAERRTSGIRFKTRYTVLTPTDADRFSRMLKRAFPSIRFHRKNYYRCFLQELNPDLTLKDLQTIHADPSNLHIPYVESMGTSDGDNFTAWIEPDDWEPFWLGPNLRGIHWVVNKPELQFHLRTSDAHEADSRANEGALELGVRRIEASYYPDQPDKKRFLDKVWRILAKMTTNKLLRVDRETRDPVEYQGGSEYCWAGPDAIRWALEHPLRTFGDDIRPAGPLEVPDLD